MNKLVKSRDSKALLEAALPSLMQLVPKHMTGERMLRIATGQLTQNPNLKNCTPESLLNSVIEASQLGIEIGVLNQGWLIPYGKQCQFQIGYGGMITLAKNSGDVIGVTVEVVREHDHFRRTQDSVEHEWDAFSDDRGEPIGAYCILELAAGNKQYETMSHTQIEKIRKLAKAKNAGPWKDHWEEMAKKTVLKRALKKVKLSAEAMTAIQKDDERFGYVQSAQVVNKLGNEAVLDMIDAPAAAPEREPGVEVDPETGEALPHDLQ